MNRLLAVSTSALLLAAGCGKNETPAPADCEPEKLDLSTCDRSTLSALQAEGIWNMNLEFTDGEHSPAVIRFSGEPRISGLPITDKQVGPDNLLLTSDLESAEGLPVRYLFAGCRASGPSRMEGVFRRCYNGAKDLEGSFEAVRLTRRSGEDEASKVQLVLELPVSSGSAQDVFIAGNHAYVSALDGGLFVFDISNPEEARASRQVASLKPTSGDAWHQVWVQGPTMYVASATRGVLVYDVTNPATPIYKRALPEGGVDARALHVEGNWLYVASPIPQAEVLILDITKPLEPTLVKRYYVENSQPELGDRPYDVKVKDGRLYVSHGAYGLTVSNVAEPSKPALLGRFSYDDASTGAVAVGAIEGRTLAFESGQDWGSYVRVLDVSAPENITQVGEYKLRSEVSPHTLTLAGTKLYVAHHQDGLRILNVSASGALEQVGYYNTWRETDTARGLSFYEGLSGIKVPGDGFIYATETSRGLMVFRELP